MTARACNRLTYVLLSLWCVIVTLTNCAPVHHPPPPPPPLLRLDVGVYDTKGAIVGAVATVQDGPNKGITGTTGAHGNVILTGLQRGGFTVCATAEGYVTNCVGVTLLEDANAQIHLAPRPPPPATLLRLIANGRIFHTSDGKPWRYMGVSSFALFDRITRGEDVRDVLDAYKGFNTLRVWPYVPRKDWGAKAWDVTYTAADARLYIAKLAELGWRVELTLLTDDNPGRLAWAQAFVPQLTAGGCPSNLLLEAGNEPLTHKHINVDALKGVLAASGCPYTSGIYEDPSKSWGTYGTSHDPRDDEWPRKVHDLLERFDGGGPYAKTDRANKVPWVGDEPKKPTDTGGVTADDARAYAGGASLFAAGATWHCETGKFGLPPIPSEAVLAAAFLEGLTAFPADTPLLPYGRPVENSLRTYTAGDRFMVRVRPTSPSPGAGWTRIGSSAVLWRR